ncbi:hypothetical protein EV215_1513 [Hypnocyclicus thermotrophus]|uniref:Lipoprotein n=1 Tax=Hypnocyclicus thermotrophus TaxID=1627895 RepID=A0AA46DXY9_9FUSO|nr:hypothetical protein [Hypnocyclicus thermotrophus]TDT69171.1 hypothetical protein EV215_1513 [Hypnocyclicus thermotrophus]
MKKIFIFIITLFIISCSNLEKKQEMPVYEKKFYYYYENWDLKNAKEMLKYIKEGKKQDYLRQKLKYKLKKEQDLRELLSNIKQELKDSKYNLLKESTLDTLENELIIKNMKKYNITKAKIYFGKIKFGRDITKVPLIISYFDDSFYFEINSKLVNEKWVFISFSERG